MKNKGFTPHLFRKKDEGIKQKPMKILKDKKVRGFTLIELLVVIAIIGILVSIVMVSMSGATAKAKNARVKGDISQIRSIAEMIYDTDGDYDAVCANATSVNTAHATYGTQLTIIQVDVSSNASSGATQATRTDCATSTTAWCYGAWLESGGVNSYYCTDSAGRAWATSGAACEAGTDCL